MNRSTKTTWTTLIALPLLLGFVIVADSPPVSAKTVLQDDAILFSCGQFPGRATRRFRVDEHGNPDLQIDVSNAPAGPYSVIIDGIDRGVLQVNALGNGQIEYDTSPGPGQLLLNFPLTIDSEIDLLFNGTTLAFSLSNDSACQNAGGTTSSSTSTSTSSTSTSTSLDSSSSTTTTTSSSSSTTSTTLGGSCQAIDNTVSLVNCGAVRGAGTRRVRVHLDCERDVRYQMRKVPNGTYSVFVADTDGNLKRGTITVSVRNQGEIEFDDTPAVNEFPLTFDPFGKVSIVRDATGARVFGYPNCQ